MSRTRVRPTPTPTPTALAASPSPAPATAVGRRTERKAATREALKRAARELFAARGYRATQIADISREAGVAHGTFYVHFASREALLDELMREFNDGLSVDLRRTVSRAGGAPAEAVVRRAARLCLTRWQAHRPLLAAFAQRASDDGDLSVALDGISPQAVQLLTEALAVALAGDARAVVDARWIAHAVLGMWARLGMHVLFGNGLSARKAEDLLTTLTLGALAAFVPALGTAVTPAAERPRAPRRRTHPRRNR